MGHSAVTLVEDDPECAAACVEELDRAGWACTWLRTTAEAVHASRAGALAPIVLMDLRLPGESAFDAITVIRRQQPEVAIVAFTSHASDDYVLRALRAGAVGYVLKDAVPGSIAHVLEDVRAGGAPMSARIARRVIESLHAGARSVEESRGAPSATTAPEITARERDVLTMLARGLSYAECAQVIGVSVNTVRTHVRNTYEKLHAGSKAEAVAIALRRGWVS